MKRIALATSLVLALSAPAFAQTNQTTAEEEAARAEAERAAENTTKRPGFHSTTVYHGPHRYPMKTRGRAGDPPIIDHSMDTLVVEPTSTRITIVP